MVELGSIGIFSTALEQLPVKQCQAVASEVEQLGYGALWIPETTADALITATVALAATDRMAVATGITSMWTRDALTANGVQHLMATLFGGRFLFGLGVSHAFLVEGLRGLTYKNPLAGLASYLDGMDESLPNAVFATRVAQLGLAEALATAATAAVPARQPRIIAALGPRMMQLARVKADGALAYLQTPEHTRLSREILGPDRTLAITQMVVMDSDPSVARAAARRVLNLYLTLPNFVKHFRTLGFSDSDFTDDGSDGLVDALFASGGVDQAQQRVADQLAAGANHVNIQVVTSNWPTDTPLQHWRDLAGVLSGLSV